MIFRKSGFLSGLNWERFQNYTSVSSGYPSQLPMNYTPGRVVQTFGLSGTGFGLPEVSAQGVAVFDFSNTRNKYMLTNFQIYNDYWDDYLARTGTWAMVSDTVAVGIDDALNESSTPDINCRVTTIAADGTVTHTTSWRDLGNQNCNAPAGESNPSVGYNGNLYYGYYQGSTSGGGYLTTNGWVDKITATTYTAMSGALQTGYTGSESSQGQPGLELAMLGYDSPNGYLVVNAARDDYATVVRYRLVNATGTPSTGAEVTWSNRTSGFSPVAMSATKVAVPFYDSGYGGYEGKIALLYTNSATTPTTLTKGAECGAPSIPTGAGFDIDDVDFIGWFSGTCSNYRSKENKFLTYCFWKLLSESTLADGDTTYTVYAPCVIESTSNSNITATIPTEDVWGNPPTLLHNYTDHRYGNYNICSIGAPDNKAVNWWINPGETTLNQQTFQL